MALKSRLFAGDKKLEAAALSHSGHIVPGASGEHVRKIQGALMIIDDATIADTELASGSYGTTTAKAVLGFKTARQVINTSYQATADNIVGMMTIKAIDDELFALEEDIVPEPKPDRTCYVSSVIPEPRPLSVRSFLAGAPANPGTRKVR